jgi:hypothetical protein
MKTQLLIWSLPIFLTGLFSCGESDTAQDSSSKNILENLTYSVDTLIVDPGDEIINLAFGLRLSDLSLDKKKLYLLNEVNQSLAVIDLDQLKLVDQYQFEKEGPNGIGEYISGVQVANSDQFVFISYQSSGIFNRSGEKVLDLNFSSKDIEGIDMEDEMPMNYGLTLSLDNGQAFALPGNFFEGTRDLAVVDPVKKTGQLIDIPAMDKTSEFRIVLKSKDMMSIYMEELGLSQIENILYLTNSASTDIYRYDYLNDSLQLFAFQPLLFPNAKTGPVKNEVSSESEWKAEMEKLRTQIGFEKLLWDEKSQRFYRFARKYYPKENPDDPSRADVYLMAFDKDLNLIGEKQLDELRSTPSYPFFKDGKLWSYVNVEDELGFAVFTFVF